MLARESSNSHLISGISVCFLLMFSALSRAQLPDLKVPEALGVNIHFTDPQPGEMEMLAAGGFRWIRMDFDWARIETKKGDYDFSPYDRLLAALAKYKIRAIFILDYANPLYDNNHSPETDEGRSGFAHRARSRARRTRGRSPTRSPNPRPRPTSRRSGGPTGRMSKTTSSSPARWALASSSPRLTSCTSARPAAPSMCRFSRHASKQACFSIGTR